jgi:hypothetical protein
MRVVSCIGQLLSGLSLQSASFSHRAVFVGFVVDRVLLGHVFLCVLHFSLIVVISPMLHPFISFRRDQYYIILAVDLNFNHFAQELSAW